MGAFCHRLALLRSSSLRGRVFNFWGNYGWRFGFARSNHLRKCELIYAVLRLVLRGCVGLLLLPLTVRAEWGSNDSTNLYLITGKTGEIKTDTQYIRQYTEWVYNSLGYSYGSTGFRLRDDLQSILKLLRTVDSNLSSSATDLTTIVSKTTKIAENSDSVITKLDEIIAALEALAESGSSSGGGSGSGTEITQDWLKETTFTTARAEDNAATQEYRDWFKSAFGFGGSSSSMWDTPSLYSYFDRGSYYRVRPSISPDIGDMLQMSYPFSPMFDLSYQYLQSSNWQAYPKRNFWTEFSFLFADNLSNVLSNQRNFTLSTQALEYYAHTNLVANLWAIHNTAPTGESPTIGFADGVLTYKDGSSASGSSAPTTQTLDLNPVATNAYDSVVGDITTLTEAVSSGTSTGDNPIDTDAIRARYFAYLDIQGASTDIGDDIRAASSSGETLKINFMGGSAELDLAAWGTSYRSIMTQERLRTWRGAMGIIWMLAAWCGGFYLVKRLGNME